MLAATFAPSASALQISVRGNHLVANIRGKTRTVRLIGVDRSGSEYACTAPDGSGGKGFGIFQGPVDGRAIHAMKTWHINAVALPLNEACWLGGYGELSPQFSGQSYQSAIVSYVGRLNRAGIYVVLRLAGAAPGDHTFGFDKGSTEIPMADADHAVAFWQSVAQQFRSNPGVLFHTYDEPHDISWDCWLHGCATVDDASTGSPGYGPYTATGQQQLVDAIRSQGATQPIILSGLDYAADLSQWQQFLPNDPSGQLVAGFNFFDYSGQLASHFSELRSVAQGHPVVVGGFGDTDCNSDFSQQLMRFADSVGISYLAWTWNTEADYGGCSNALLGPTLKAYDTGQPSGYGAGVRKHYRKLHVG